MRASFTLRAYPFLLCRYTDHVYLKGANPLGDGALYLWSQKLSLNTPVARFSGEQKVEFKIIGGESCRVIGLQGCRVAAREIACTNILLTG